MLTKEGKYGLKVMVHLAGRPVGEATLVNDIANANEIPKKFLDRILGELGAFARTAARRASKGFGSWIAGEMPSNGRSSRLGGNQSSRNAAVTNDGGWSRPPNAATHRGADLQSVGQLLWQDDIELLAKRVGEQVRITFHRNCGADVNGYDPMFRAGRI
ncbi:MAG: hypothetical protein ACRED2_01795 [Methylocella sp.]